MVRDDFLLYARGVARIYYEPEYETEDDENARGVARIYYEPEYESEDDENEDIEDAEDISGGPSRSDKYAPGGAPRDKRAAPGGIAGDIRGGAVSYAIAESNLSAASENLWEQASQAASASPS
jgi:hypothetical protein